MAFWGIEVKPGKPFKQAVDECCQLRLTQATLGEQEPSSKRVAVKCKSGDGPGIFICSFIPGAVESCSLDLLFDEEIAFSVVGGSSSVHLAGYFEHMEEQEESDINDDSQDESEDGLLFGVDGSGTDEYSEEEEDEDMVGQVRNSGVKIEEILDDETAVIGNGKKTTTQKLIKSLDHAVEEKSGAKKLKKQHQAAGEVDIDAEKNGETKCLESSDIDQSDEDGFAVKTKRKAEKMKENGLSKKRQAIDSKMKEQNSEEQAHVESLSHNETPEESEKSEKTKKQKKKKKKAKDTENKTELPETPKQKSVEASEKTPSKEPQSSGKKGILSARKFPNGLEVQDIATGKPDGKQAKPGTRVGMIYIGRLKSNGKIFDSNVGKRPFEFRLGVGEVIKGWDVGVNGMRVGDKRKLTIPPAMGYGSKGVGSIPPNSWLVFDVELVHVK